MSVTALSVPSVVDKVTVAPPEIRLLPFASFNLTVMVDVLVPFAVIDAGAAVIVDVDALAAPGANVTVSLSVIAVPPTVPLMVALPAVVDEVSVTVYVPSPLSVTELNVPELAVNTGKHAPLVRLAPFSSLSWIVIVVVLVPFAEIDPVAAVMVEVAAEANAIRTAEL